MPFPGRHPSPDGDSKDVRVGDARRVGWGGCLDGDLGEPSLHGGVHDNHRRGRRRGQQQQQVRSPSTSTNNMLENTPRQNPTDWRFYSCSMSEYVHSVPLRGHEGRPPEGKEPHNLLKN